MTCTRHGNNLHPELPPCPTCGEWAWRTGGVTMGVGSVQARSGRVDQAGTTSAEGPRKADVESLLRQLRGERSIDRSIREVAQGIRDPHYGIGNGSATANLQGLVLSLFSASELRTFVRYGEDGERLEGGLPGVNASAADIAFAVANAWQKHRHVDRSLMERMIAERPRRASDIRRVFEQFGVH